MDKGKLIMEKLIKKGITNLLSDITDGKYKDWTSEDLAEQKQINVEMVHEYIYEHHTEELYEHGVDGESQEVIDEFQDHITLVLNSEWYEKLYHDSVEYAEQGILDEQDWERTKQTLRKVWSL